MANPYDALYDADAQKGNPYDELFEQDSGNTVKQIVQTPAPAKAKVLNLGKETGWDTGLVERNQPDAEAEAKSRRIKAWAEQFPSLNPFLYSNPDAGSVLQDDLPLVGPVMESPLMKKRPTAADFPITPERGFAQASGALLNAQREHDAAVLRYMNTLTPEKEAPTTLGTLMASFPATNEALWGVARATTDLLSEYVGQPMAGTILPEDIFARMSKQFEQYAVQQGDIAKDLRGDRSQLGTVGQGYYSGIESLGQNLLLFPMSLATGTPAPTLLGMSAATGGAEYNKAREKGLTPAQAITYAASQAAVEYATEKIPMTRLLGDLKAGTPFFQTLVRNVAAEVPGEQVATLVQDMNEWAALNPEKPFQAYIDERPSAAAQTLIATIVASGGQISIIKGVESAVNAAFGPNPAVVEQQRKAAQAQAAEGFADGMAQAGQQIAQTQAATQGPAGQDALAAALREVDEGTEVIVDARLFTETLNQAGVDVAEVLGSMPGVADQYANAMDMQGDIAIPRHEYLARIATTPAFEPLNLHIRESEDALSMYEAQTFYQARAEEMQQAMERVAQETAQDVAWQESKKRVEDDLFQQMQDAGRFTADKNKADAMLASEMFAVWANRMAKTEQFAGMTPEDAYRMFALRVASERGAAGGQVMEQPGGAVFNWDNPGGGIREIKVGDTTIAYGYDGKSAHIASVRTPSAKRNKGSARAAMQRFLAETDALGIPVKLESSPLDKRTKDARLFNFYKSLGFEPTGRKINAVGDPEMLRAPRQTTQAPINPLATLAQAVKSLFTGGQREQGVDQSDLIGAIDTTGMSATEARVAVASVEAAALPAGYMRLWRADKQARSDLRAFSSWTDESSTAIAYTDNPGFGGPVLSYVVTPDEGVLDLYDSNALNFEKLAEVLGYDDPLHTADEWAGYGWRYPWEESKEVKNRLRLSGYSFLRYADDFPDAASTYIPLKDTAAAQPTQAPANPLEGLDMGQFFQGAQPAAYTADTIEVDGVDRPTMNSNGQRIAQTEEGLRNFWRWFGDSKVVDNEGRPLVVYHGTGADFTEFRASNTGTMGPGVYFAFSREAAQEWAGRYRGGRVIEAYLRAENPVEIASTNEGSELWDRFAPEGSDREMVLGLRQAGHDAAWATGSADSPFGRLEPEIVVYDPTQIKSATGNRGTFDPGDANILNQSGFERWTHGHQVVELGEAHEFQADEADNRAEIAFGDITAQASVITLFEKADLSSFLHEMGHFQLEVLAHLAAQPNAPAEIKEDMDRVLKWFGIRGDETVKGGEQGGALGQSLPDVINVDGVGRPTVNSNGQRIAQTEEGLRNFWRWFGDSRVVDDQGRPLVVYRGDTIKREVIEPQAGMIWLAENEGYAKGFAGENGDVSALYAAVTAPFDAARFGSEEQPLDAWAEILSGEGVDMSGVDLVDWAPDYGLYTFYDLLPHAGNNYLNGADNGLLSALRGAGFDGIKSPDEDAVGVDSGAVYVAFSSTQIKSAIGNRGTFDPDDPNILNQGDEQTTPDPASLPKRRTPLEVWRAMSLEEKRPYHEMFARGFEAYLFEGKAPTAELSGLFHRFRSWLISVYKSIKALNVQINDELRGVFDRMVATDEAIAQAQEERGMLPLFPDDPAMVAEAEQATQDAQDELQRRSLRDMRWLTGARGRILKQLQRDAKEKRKAVEAEVRAEVQAMPVYAAMRFLRTGTLSTTDQEEIKAEVHRLDKAALAEMYPESMLARPDVEGLKGMTRKDGLHPDLVAEMLSAAGYEFTSGDHLVREILGAEPEAQLIEGMTDQRVLERYGDIASPDALARAADEAIHNEARLRAVATELNALTKAQGPVRAMTKAAKDFAATMVARTKVRNIKPAQHAAAEARAAKAAHKATAAGDTTMAVNEKRKQLVEGFATRLSYDALSEVERIIRHFKQIQKSGSQKNMRGEYLVQMNALLARFDFRQKPDQVKTPLGEWVLAEADRLSAVAPALPDWVLDEQFVKPYKDMTLEELRGLNDAVRQLEHMARREQKMYKEVRDLSYQQEVESILAELRTTNPDAFEGDDPREYRKDALPLVKEFVGRFQSKFDAEFVNIENLLDVMTKGKGNAVFESLFGRLSAAQDERTAYVKELGQYLRQFTSAYTPKERLEMAFTKRLVPGTNLYLTREQRIAVALFYGSEEGRQRLADGNRYNAQQTQAIIDSLDEKDVALIKGMWRMSEEKVWPRLAALHERTVGVPLAKVQAVPFRHSTLGELPGGYVPLVYDGDMDTRAHDLSTNSAVQELLGGTMTTAATQRSASKERAEKVNRPLDLSLRAMAFKINETVHDITHREAVADTYRLLQSTRVSNALRMIAGPDAYNAMLYHVREVAVKPRTPSGFMEKAFWYFRKNTLINLMGASFNTIAINVLGAAPAMRRVGPARFIAAVSKLTTPGAAARYNWVLEKSPYMRERLSSFDRDMNEELSRLGSASVMPSLAFWFAGLSVMDRSITMPLWLAAYEQGMAEHGNDEKAAVGFADRTVRQTQGSGRAVDLAKIAGGVGPAGEAKRILTMFYNFFNAQLGQIRRSGAIAGGAWSAGQKAKAAAILTLDVLAVIVIPATLEAIARGNCGDDPDAEDYLYCGLRSSALFTAGFFPLLRDVLPYTWRQFDPDFQGGFGVRLSPIENALETMARLPKATVDAATGDATESDEKTLVRGFGYLFGLPGFQAWRTLDGYRALSEGDSSDPTDLLTGPPRD